MKIIANTANKYVSSKMKACSISNTLTEVIHVKCEAQTRNILTALSEFTLEKQQFIIGKTYWTFSFFFLESHINTVMYMFFLHMKK